MNQSKYVIFYRVSTKRQGESGLGLEAQRRDINIFLETYADDNHKVISEHTSIHSGSNIEDCPHFQQAIKDCKTHNATLLVAKVDRLSRKVSVFSRIIEEIDVTVAMMPSADKFQLHLYSALAEEERTFISKRTKAALQEAKAKGVKLGGNRKGAEKANVIKKEKANQRAEKYRAMLSQILETATNYSEVAKKMTAINTEGKHFQISQVQRLMKRLELSLPTV